MNKLIGFGLLFSVIFALWFNQVVTVRVGSTVGSIVAIAMLVGWVSVALAYFLGEEDGRSEVRKEWIDSQVEKDPSDWNQGPHPR